MLRIDQTRRIIYYLLNRKRLPLELLVEVQDHMTEQIEAQMKDENCTFDEAFLNAKAYWNEDLTMVNRTWIPTEKKITRIQKETEKSIKGSLLSKSLKIYMALFFAFVALALQFPDVAVYYWVFLQVLVLVSIIFIWIFDWKVMRSTRRSYKKDISFFQNVIRSCFSFASVTAFLSFISYYSSDVNSIYSIAHFIFNINEIAFSTNEIKALQYFLISFKLIPILYPFISVYCFIRGFLGYQEYKKSIRILVRKINLKL